MESNSPVFRSGQASKLSGVPITTMNRWRESGLAPATGKRPPGLRGQTSWYSFADVLNLRAAARLRAAGVPVSRIERVVVELRKLDLEGHPLARVRLVVLGDDVLRVESDRQLVSVLKQPGQFALAVIALGDLEQELRRDTEASKAKPATVWKTSPRRRRSGRAA
jgi:DNA-binding transcriptional MerR regulator